MEPLRITLSTGRSLRETAWKREDMLWEDFKRRCATPKRTGETFAAYLGMNRDSQSAIKDVGGFVGAVFSGPRRKASMVTARTALTFDIDDTKGRKAQVIWDIAVAAFPTTAMVCYSTHKHTDREPRLRIVIPLDHPKNVETYQAAARMAAKVMGILDIVDPTTFDVERLFFWPSAASDGDFFYRAQDGRALDVTEILGLYAKSGLLWNDQASWPKPPNAAAVATFERPKAIGGQLSDPLEKPGIVGAFCRAYSPINVGIDDLLPDVYSRGQQGRYTHIGSTSSNGLVLYGMNDGDPVMRFAMSHHATDPACGVCCNIWDLVRIHRFAHLDEGSRAEGVNLPSYKAMTEFAAKDQRTNELILAEKLKAFEGVELPCDADGGNDGTIGQSKEEKPEKAKRKPISGEWTTKLKKRKVKGAVTDENLPCVDNILLIFDNDPNIAGLVGYNLMRETIEKRSVPHWGGPLGIWTDRDDASLRIYIEHVYGITARDKVQDVLSQTADRNKFHPVREYLESLPPWDPEKSPRRLDTLFIDALGAEDSELNRAISRKTLVAAVARVMSPGCKFDHCLTLIGPEGIGKSTIFRLLAGDEYYNDSVATFEGKDALEQMQGAWIVEIAELSAASKSDIARTKQVITIQEDKYRKAYGRRTESYKRQCIIVGTSNEGAPLRGETGNRRFWLMPVGVGARRLQLSEIVRIRDEVWAEALYRYRQGETLYLDNDSLADEMRRRQKEGNASFADDPIPALLEQFLEMELPDNWAEMDIFQRRDFVRGNQTNTFALRPRLVFSACEFICEALGKDLSDINYKSYARRVSVLMKEHPEWEYGGEKKSGHGAKLYGRQRYWVRLSEYKDDDL